MWEEVQALYAPRFQKASTNVQSYMTKCEKEWKSSFTENVKKIVTEFRSLDGNDLSESITKRLWKLYPFIWYKWMVMTFRGTDFAVRADNMNTENPDTWLIDTESRTILISFHNGHSVCAYSPTDLTDATTCKGFCNTMNNHADYVWKKCKAQAIVILGSGASKIGMYDDCVWSPYTYARGGNY
jgi:hypothetical protein